MGSEGDEGSSSLTPLPVGHLSRSPDKKNAWLQVQQKWIMGEHCLQLYKEITGDLLKLQTGDKPCPKYIDQDSSAIATK